MVSTIPTPELIETTRKHAAIGREAVVINELMRAVRELLVPRQSTLWLCYTQPDPRS
jgi:hypothetical protein